MEVYSAPRIGETWSGRQKALDERYAFCAAAFLASSACEIESHPVISTIWPCKGSQLPLINAVRKVPVMAEGWQGQAFINPGPAVKVHDEDYLNGEALSSPITRRMRHESTYSNT